MSDAPGSLGRDERDLVLGGPRGGRRVAGDPRSTRGRCAGELHPLARLPEEWREVLERAGERAYRGDQVFRWIHAKGELDARRMTDLSLSTREIVASFGLAVPARIDQVDRASDKTRKLVLSLEDQARVECVLIPMTASGDADDPDDGAGDEDIGREETALTRVTLCVSTQYGCAMGCAFCASGRAGLKRGLGAAEIVAQVLLARGQLEHGEVLRNVVFMGMGEPLQHYDETARALKLLTHAAGLDMSLRRITVSTVGLIPGITQLGRDFGGKVGLAVSLHAGDDVTRDRLVPMNRRYPLAAIMKALREYPLPRRRRITIEYTLIRGVNDTPEQARAVARLLRGLRVKVNLIPMNPIAGSELGASEAEAVEQFRAILAAAGYSCLVRTRRGDAVSAACGQLALRR